MRDIGDMLESEKDAALEAAEAVVRYLEMAKVVDLVADASNPANAANLRDLVAAYRKARAAESRCGSGGGTGPGSVFIGRFTMPANITVIAHGGKGSGSDSGT